MAERQPQAALLDQDKICIVDSRSKKVREIFAVGPYTIWGFRVSKDSRLIYCTLEMNEADIWLMTLK